MTALIITAAICLCVTVNIIIVCASVEDTVENYLEKKYPKPILISKDTTEPDVKPEDMPPTFDEIIKLVNAEWEGVEYEERTRD